VADLTSPYCISTCIPLKCTQGARSYLAWQERHTWSPPPGSIIQWEKPPLSTHFVRRLAHWHLLPITLNKPLSITEATSRCYRREYRRWRCCRSKSQPYCPLDHHCSWKLRFYHSLLSKLQGVFFNWYPPKSSKCQLVSKSWHLELFWWDLLCNLTLRTFRGVPVTKKHPELGSFRPRAAGPWWALGPKKVLVKWGLNTSGGLWPSIHICSHERIQSYEPDRNFFTMDHTCDIFFGMLKTQIQLHSICAI